MTAGTSNLLQPFDAYLFDLDGTLVDSAPDIHAALNHALVDTQLPEVELSLTRDFVGMGSKALIRRALEHHQTNGIETKNANPGLMLDRFLQFYQSNLAVHSTVFPGTCETLEALKQRGAQLAVVTNKYIGLSQSVLEALELKHFFSCVVGSETTANPKPAPDPALYACNELGVAPNNALFIGDASPDVGCAKAAGCPVVVLRDGYNNGIPASELGADGVIDNLTQLLSYPGKSS